MRLQRAWYQSRAPLWLWLLWPLQLLFVALSGLRRLRFRYFPAKPLPVPVIVVGNISVGGTGKTPVTLALVDYLKAQGERPGVISRGYGGRGPFPYSVTAQSDAQRCGDEPLLLARRTQVPMVVAPDRYQAALWLLQQAPSTTVIISDDGLQHYALPRQFEIAVIDGQRGVGNGWRLPMGPLREAPARLQSVDAVITNGKLNNSLPCAMQPYQMVLQAQGWRRLSDDMPVDKLPEGKTLVVAGIGHPERFFATVRTLEKRAFTTRAFADHHAFSDADYAAVSNYDVVLMTEKDATKWRGNPAQACYYLPVKAQLPEAFWQQLQQALRNARYDA